jgi:hypothetical protein
MMERIQDVASLVHPNKKHLDYFSINTRDLLESCLPVLHLMSARKRILAERTGQQV